MHSHSPPSCTFRELTRCRRLGAKNWNSKFDSSLESSTIKYSFAGFYRAIDRESNRIFLSMGGISDDVLKIEYNESTFMIFDF